MFGERMSYLEKEKRPFINYAPNKLNTYVHQTNCNLLLYTTCDNDLKVMRASMDLYPYDTNFGELPVLPIRVSEGQILDDT